MFFKYYKMPKVKDIIIAVGDALSKIINACKCSCKSCCCESDCHERAEITPPSSPGVEEHKPDIVEFSNKI